MENLKCLFSNFPLDVFLFWLLPLLLLWWWLSRRISNYKASISELQDRITFLEAELDACRKSKVLTKSTVDVDAFKTRIAKLEADLDACNKAKLAALATGAVGGAIAGNAGASRVVASEPQKKDDLKIVEGIGPKIESLCHKAGIYTFAELAVTPADKLKSILVEAGSRYQMHDPSTWPKQAELARDGKWDELKKWQDELNKGRE